MTQPRKKPAKKVAAKKAAKKAPARKRTRSPKARPETSPVDVLAQFKIGQALDLRIKGCTFRQIADALDVNVATAHRYVQTGLTELTQLQDGKAKELRAMELARLDTLLMKVWPFATGDLGPLIRELEAKREELAELDPKAAKNSLVAKLLEAFVDGIPQDDYLKRALDIIRTRSRLLGLEAPVKHAATDPTGEEERAIPVAFPVPPMLDPAAWQKFAAQAAKEGQADG